jgi:protein-arginine kinase activator protein McsA
MSSPERTRQGKLVCPDCGHAGWGAHWWERHRVKQHTPCEDCGRSFISLVKHQQRGCPAGLLRSYRESS